VRSTKPYIALFILFGLFSNYTFAEVTPFEKASKAVEKKQYKQAILGFENILKEDPNNTSAYYNLGVAYLGKKSYGNAIWAFEKVLNRIPNDSETIEQLEYAHRELNTDFPFEPRLNAFASGLYSISSNKWSIIAIICSILITIAIVLFKLNSSHSIRRMTAVSGFILSILFLSSIILASSTKEYQTEMNYGVVTKKSIQTFDQKYEVSNKKIMEGARLRLLQKDSAEFMLVETQNREQFFVRYEDIQYI
jgi:tetratricopeptide (TPR) repeat protein